MAEFILKDRYGKDRSFDKETIFVQGADGELMQFTHGTGNPVIESLTITENGTYTAPDGVDGYNPITVNVDPSRVTILREQQFDGFVMDSNFGAFSPGFVTPSLFVLKDGETYHVVWDGEEKECVAYSFPYGDMTIVAIGNGSSLRLPGNGEKFLITYNVTADGTQLFSTEQMDSHTVGIWQKVTVASDDVRYVTFKSYDGSVEYGKKPVAVGDDCADPIARGIFATPTRESDAQYNYTFYGWATEPNGGADANWNKAIAEDKTVYANFASAVRYYTVTYYDDDGATVLKTESLAYGTMPNFVPTKTGYVLDSWEPKAVAVTGNTSYKAVWAKQMGLDDYTWTELDAMSLEEAKEKFKLGDRKGMYALVGFNQDTKTDGTKAKMSFICLTGLKYTSFYYNCPIYTTHTKYYKDPNNDPASNVYGYSDELGAVVKPVQKKYLDSRTNKTFSTVNVKFWTPSASEIGCIVDGTNVFDEGPKYDLFNEVALGQSYSTVTPLDMAITGNKYLRSAVPGGQIYLKSGKITKLTSGQVYNVYSFIGFCI